MSSATADAITSAKSKSIQPSLFDTDELLEEQRFHICRRAMQPVLELGVRMLENTLTGKSKYYTVYTQAELSNQEKPKYDEDFMQLFDCPTEPKMYVYINGFGGKNTIWAILKESEIDRQRLFFNIMGYMILPARSITIYNCTLLFLLLGGLNFTIKLSDVHFTSILSLKKKRYMYYQFYFCQQVVVRLRKKKCTKK